MGMMGAVFGVLGGVMQGMGAMQQHEAEAQAHEYNAAVADRNAQIIREQTATTVLDQQDANMRELASIRGMFAYTGLSFTGSATDVTYDTIHAQKRGEAIITYKGRLAEIEQLDKATSERMGAQAQHDAAPLSLVAGIVGGLSSGLSSFSQTA